MRLEKVLVACTVAAALQNIRPGAEWVLNGDTYQGLNWLDKTQNKPTRAEILAALADCDSADIARKSAKAQARLDVKNQDLTQQQRLQALLILLDFDQ